ncbi:hypothetical protein ACLIYP_27075 [Streptomyces nanhaiensis]|uniref:hypothetical protein n=1 Tax=Streptomyces nanhaiensis TaxID=679319 RepID=UPI00399CD31E
MTAVTKADRPAFGKTGAGPSGALLPGRSAQALRVFAGAEDLVEQPGGVRLRAAHRRLEPADVGAGSGGSVRQAGAAVVLEVGCVGRKFALFNPLTEDGPPLRSRPENLRSRPQVSLCPRPTALSV